MSKRVPSRKFITAASVTSPDGTRSAEVEFDPPVSVYEALMKTAKA
jgi:hypothetical protein